MATAKKTSTSTATATGDKSAKQDWSTLPNLLAGCARTKDYHALVERYNDGERSEALARDIQALAAS